MKWISIPLIFIMILGCSFIVYPLKNIIRKISLRNAILMAQQNDIELNNYKLDSEVFDAEYKQAITNFLPNIIGEVTSSHNMIHTTNPRGITTFSVYGSATIPVYNRAYLYNKRKALSQIIYNRLNIVKRLNNLCKEIATLYYSSLNLKSIAKIRKAEYLKTKENLRITKLKLKHRHQKTVPLDVILVQGLLIENKNNWIDAVNDYIRERNKLSHKLELNSQIRLIEPKQDILVNKLSYDKSIKRAMFERMDIKCKLFEAKIKREVYETQRSIFYPKLDLFTDIKYAQRAQSTDQTDWSIFVLLSMALTSDVNLSGKTGVRKYNYIDKPVDEESMKVSLFDKTSPYDLSSNSIRAKNAQAKSDYLKTQQEIKNIKNKIKEEVEEAFHQLIKAKNKIKLAKVNLIIGKGLLKRTNAESKLGRKGMEDVIEAKKKEVQYKVEYHLAILDFRLAVLNLKWAIGYLWKDFY